MVDFDRCGRVDDEAAFAEIIRRHRRER